MAAIYVQYYNDNGLDKALDFCLKNSVSYSILTSLYDRFLKDNEIEDIKALPTEKKQKYWDTSCKYFHTQEERIKASKACYTLDLITANF